MEKISKAVLKKLIEIAKNNSAEIEARGDLEERKNDEDDFIEVSVWGLKDMLIQAYQLGKSV